MKTKLLFGVLIGWCFGAAIMNFVVFASLHRWINLGSGVFCLACGVFCIVMGRLTLETQAETRRIEAETERLRQETAGILRRRADRRLVDLADGRNPK